MEKVVEFVIPLGPNDRRRHRHISQKGKIAKFIVQYETKIANKWHAVIRYDTAHGFAHKDILHFGKSSDKIKLVFSDLNEALTFADNDIKSNWKKYKAQFINEGNLK